MFAEGTYFSFAVIFFTWVAYTLAATIEKIKFAVVNSHTQFALLFFDSFVHSIPIEHILFLEFY